MFGLLQMAECARTTAGRERTQHYIPSQNNMLQTHEIAAKCLIKCTIPNLIQIKEAKTVKSINTRSDNKLRSM